VEGFRSDSLSDASYRTLDSIGPGWRGLG
jgi:hypothetical protein